MQEFAISLDTDIFMWVNSRHNQYWDAFMYVVSSRTAWIPLYAMMLYAIYLSFGWRTMILMGLMTAVAVAAADQISASLLRPLFERLRPSNLDNPISQYVHIVQGHRGGRYGFPSSHAANTFAVATLTSLLFRRKEYTICVILWAIAVCYSRLYLGMHYPGDILAGLSVGAVCGAVCYACAGFVLLLFVKVVPYKHEARQIVATYRRGAPSIRSRIFGHDITWRPTYLPVATAILTTLLILLYSAIFN